MRYIAALSLATLGLFFGPTVRAQIPNDDIEDAIEISMEERIARVQGKIVGADSTDFVGFPDVWYKFDPPISGKIYSQLQGLGYFMWVGVFTLDEETGERITVAEYGTSYSYGSSGTSTNTDNYDVEGGKTYYVNVVSGSQLSVRPRGSFDFNYLHVFTAGQISDTFANRTPIGGKKASIRINLSSLTTETDEPVHSTAAIAPAGKTGWLTITKPVRTQIKLNAESTNFEPIITVYTGDTLTALTKVAQSTPTGSLKETSASMTFVAEANVPYAIVFDGNRGKAGVFTLEYEASTVKPGFLVRPQPQTVQEGESTTFSVTTATTGEATYQWQILPPGTKTWLNLSDDETHFDVTTDTLIVNGILLEANNTKYRVLVTDTVGVSTSPAVLLTVTEYAPSLTEVLGTMTLDISTTRLVDDLEGVTFYIKGLPRGLTLDPATGVISGQISSAARPGIYRVTYGTIKNGKRSPNQMVVLIEVSPFAPTLIGAFEGLLLDNASLPVGKLSLKVSNKGAYTGSYFHLPLGRSFSVRGTLELDQVNRTAGTPVGAPLTIALGRGLPTYTLEFTLSEPSGADPAQFGSLVAYLSDGTLGLVAQSLDGRAVSRSTSAVPAPWAGTYTMVLSDGVLVGNDPSVAIPLGAGYATGTVSKLGALSLRGLLPDNTKFTAKLASSTEADFLLAQRHRAVGGSLAGAINLETQISSDFLSTEYHSASTSGSALYWIKPEFRRDALYPNGFGSSPIRFNTLMEPWTKSTGQVASSLGLSSNGDMKINIVAAVTQDSNDALTTQVNNYGLPIDVRLSALGRLTFVQPSENPTKFTLSINSTTGAYTGSYELAEPIVPPATKSAKIRKVKFSGVLLQLASAFQGDLIGAGFAIVPPFDATEMTTSALLDFRAGTPDSPFEETVE